MIKDHKKKMVTKVLSELEGLLHDAIEEDRVGNLNVFEMIMVSADTLDKAYRIKKKEKKVKNDEPTTIGKVIEFKRK